MPAPAAIATDKPSEKAKTPEVTAAAAAGSAGKVEIAGGPAAKEPASAAPTVQTGQPAQDAATPGPAPQVTADGKPVPTPAADGNQKADEQKSVAAARGETPANAPRFALPDPSGNASANTQNANAQSAANAAQTLSVPAPAGQPAAHAAATAAAPPPQTPAAAPVPLAGVAVAIAARASAGTNHFAIRLDPPELGRIEVRLNVDKDGRITSHLVADRKDTLALLQRDVSGLQRTLQDAGFKTADNGLQFSLRDSGQQQQQQQQQQQSNGGNAGHLVLNDETPATEAIPSGYGRYLGRVGGVDIRV